MSTLFSTNGNVIFGRVSDDATYGTYPTLKANGSGNRSTDFALCELPDADATTKSVSYYVEFDAYITLGNTKTRSQSEISLGAGATPTTGNNAVVGSAYAFDAYTTAPADSDTAVNTDWNTPGVSSTYTIPNETWCHYTIKVTSTYAETGNTYEATASIVSKASTPENVLPETSVTATGLPRYVHFLLGRGNTGDSIDNIIVYGN